MQRLCGASVHRHLSVGCNNLTPKESCSDFPLLYADLIALTQPFELAALKTAATELHLNPSQSDTQLIDYVMIHFSRTLQLT